MCSIRKAEIMKIVEKAHINIVKCGVLDVKVQAIVNAANTSLLGGGGVDGAIHRAAGPELLVECRTLHGCPTGGAKATGAYNITYADTIIHTVGPVYSGRPEDVELLASCYRNSLDLALEKGCTSIAFPCISTGIFNFPNGEAASIAYNTIKEYLDNNKDSFDKIIICIFIDTYCLK